MTITVAGVERVQTGQAASRPCARDLAPRRLAGPESPPAQVPSAAGGINALIADAVTAVGRGDFPAALAALCEAASGYDSTFMAAYFPGTAPIELFDNLPAAACDATVYPYLDFAWMLDPFHDLFRRGIGDAVVSLADCAPEDFKRSEYFRTFYAGTGLFDETSVFVAFEGGASLVLSLGSRDPDFVLTGGRRAALTDLLPVVAALCRRHWPRFEAATLSQHGRLGLQLMKAFERFGSSVLSEREIEVVQLILKGHCSKSAARQLGNSPETVKVHRKRIYRKLDIASQGELFSLFLEALAGTPANALGDPLIYLNRTLPA